jgi:DNA replication licensing factor MCM2
LLGQLVKEKVQLYRHQRGENPPSVQISVNQLETRAKDLEIYDVAPFLKSKLFVANGYKVIPGEHGGSIEKVFTRIQNDD